MQSCTSTWLNPNSATMAPAFSQVIDGSVSVGSFGTASATRRLDDLLYLRRSERTTFFLREEAWYRLRGEA